MSSERNKKREQLRVFVENTNQITETIWSELEEIFSISIIHESVKEYIEKSFHAKNLQSPFNIHTFQQAFDYLYTYKEVFKIDHQDQVFPGIYIGGEQGVYFYLLLETGKVLSIHHDSLVELGWDFFDEEQSLETGLKNLLEENSLFNIKELLNLNHALKEYDYDDLEDAFDIEEMREMVGKHFNWSKKTLDAKTGHLAMEFLYELLEEEF